MKRLFIIYVGVFGCLWLLLRARPDEDLLARGLHRQVLSRLRRAFYRLQQGISGLRRGPRHLLLQVLSDEADCGGPMVYSEGGGAWQNNKGKVSPWPSPVIPIVISEVYDNTSRDGILLGIRMLEANTCIRFVAPTGYEPYVNITNGRGGCNAMPGYVNSPGYVSVVHLHSPECILRAGHVLHELLHVLGFYHEHQRHDRDQHVKIIYDNILPGHEVNFKKVYTETFGLPYDVGSVMHYGARGFCADCSRNTIEAIRLETLEQVHHMGQRLDMSAADVARVNRLYDCTDHYLGDDLPGAIPYIIWKCEREPDHSVCQET